MREWDFRTQTHNNKRVFGGKTWNGFIIAKSLGKYEQRYKKVSAIIVAKPLTRPPMKRGERPTVSTYIGVIILFLTHIHKNCNKQIFMKKPKNAIKQF